jgi:hypothetical protein
MLLLSGNRGPVANIAFDARIDTKEVGLRVEQFEDLGG